MSYEYRQRLAAAAATEKPQTRPRVAQPSRDRQDDEIPEAPNTETDVPEAAENDATNAQAVTAVLPNAQAVTAVLPTDTASAVLDPASAEVRVFADAANQPETTAACAGEDPATIAAKLATMSDAAYDAALRQLAAEQPDTYASVVAELNRMNAAALNDDQPHETYDA